MDWIARLLTFLGWLGVAALLVITYRIAYFYQVSTKQPTHYRWFFVPLGLFLLGGLRYSMISYVAGDVLGDSLLLLGGLMLTLLGTFLLREMLGGRR